jgi:hypothetical protein
VAGEIPGRQPIITEWVLETPPVPILTSLVYDYQTDRPRHSAGRRVRSDEASDDAPRQRSPTGRDNSALLATVRPGDRLTLGGITWTVWASLTNQPACTSASCDHAALGDRLQTFTLATGVT